MIRAIMHCASYLRSVRLLHQYLRSFASVRPVENVYGVQRSRNPITMRIIEEKFKRGEALSMVTAYDYPSAVHVENSDIDFLLVGDSAAMVVHGYETTLPMRLDDMILHCQSVTRGASRPFIVGDLPFGSYEQSKEQAIVSATRMLKEGSVDAVKLEGGSPSRVASAGALVDAGIAVMGHVGLTPQLISIIGGFRPQAQVAKKAMETIDQAKQLEKAGCFALVLECVPAAVGAALQKAVDIPVIGIGAGPACAGQHPHHAKVMPKFCKRYAEVGQVINAALKAYNKEVKNHTFPGKQYSPYPIQTEEIEKLCASLKAKGMSDAADAARHMLKSHSPEEKFIRSVATQIFD